MSTNGSLNRKLRMALCGGGQGSFIGRVHATALCWTIRAALVAGCLSIQCRTAKASSAPDYDIPLSRRYTSIQELVDARKGPAPESERVDFVTVATPNHTHYDSAKAAVRGRLQRDLRQAAHASTSSKPRTWTGWSIKAASCSPSRTTTPAIRWCGRARQMIQAGELGEINAIRAFYIQGWLRTRFELSEPKAGRLAHRSGKSGAAGCFGDIATHAYNLARYITGLHPGIS